MKNLVQQLTEELTAQTARAELLEAQVKTTKQREQVLQQIIDGLFQIAEPGPVKNSLWARYQGLEQQEYILYWHPSEMYTARLAYDDDRPLWGSERLEVLHDGRWIPGKAGQPHAGGGMVVWPREKSGNPEYIALRPGSVVRNVSKPVGDGTEREPS